MTIVSVVFTHLLPSNIRMLIGNGEVKPLDNESGQGSPTHRIGDNLYLAGFSSLSSGST